MHAGRPHTVQLWKTEILCISVRRGRPVASSAVPGGHVCGTPALHFSSDSTNGQGLQGQGCFWLGSFMGYDASLHSMQDPAFYCCELCCAWFSLPSSGAAT